MRIGGWSWALVVEVRGWWADWCCFWPSDCIPESQGQEEEGPKPCVARAAIIATDRCWTSSWKREVVCQEPRIGKRVRVGQIRFPLQRLGESEKKLEDIVHDANRFVDSIRRFASQGLQISEKRLSVLAGRSQPAQGAKGQALGCCERSDEESWRLTGRAASSSTNSWRSVSLRLLWTGLAASLRQHMIACRRTIRTLVNLQNRTEMRDTYPSREPAHGDIFWIEKWFWSVNDGWNSYV